MSERFIDAVDVDTVDDAAQEEQFAEPVEAQVARYLIENPDWLLTRDDILRDITLAHDSGSAVSLLERQAQLLREQNKTLQHQLGTLLTRARTNEQLLAHSKQLVLTLLDAPDLDALVHHCSRSLRDHFTLEFVSFIIFGDPQDHPTSTVRIVPLDKAYQAIPNLLKTDAISCGILRPEEHHFLWSESADQVGSAAVVPLNRVPPLGVLALGSRDPDRFDAKMSTLFLRDIADVLKRLLPVHLR